MTTIVLVVVLYFALRNFTEILDNIRIAVVLRFSNTRIEPANEPKGEVLMVQHTPHGEIRRYENGWAFVAPGKAPSDVEASREALLERIFPVKGKSLFTWPIRNKSYRGQATMVGKPKYPAPLRVGRSTVPELTMATNNKSALVPAGPRVRHLRALNGVVSIRG